MPDVSRSNSQRSDASQKPRVSFNRDVHVKRIGREGVISALAGDGEGHLIPLPVRRERPSRLSREDLEKEAETILRQAERINCIPSTGPGKFSTLPPRPKNKKSGPPAVTSIFNSLDRRNKKKKNITQANEVFQEKNQKNNRIDDEKLGKRRYSNPDIESQRVEIIIPPLSGGKSIRNNRVKRSVSDVGNRNDRISIFATLDRIKKKKENKTKLDKLVASDEIKKYENDNNSNNNSNKNYNKKQLSPIMEKDSPQIAESNKLNSPFKFLKSKNNDKNNNSGDNRKDVGKEGEEVKRLREGEEEVRGVNTATPTVVYAEVVSKPGLSKHTVHKAVVQEHASTTQHNQLGSESEDVVDMGHRSNQNRRFSYDGEIAHKPKEFTVDIVRESDYPSKYKTSDEELPEERIINMIRAKSNPLLDNDSYVGGYRREVRTERVIRIEGAEEPDGRGRADGMDYNGRRRESKEYFENEHIVKRNHIDNFDRHDLDKFKKSESIFNQSLDIDCNDMSLRRDRLQERLGKSIRRYTSTANESSSYRDDKVRNNAARKEFLMSQIDSENNNKERHFEKKIVTEIDKHRQHVSKSKDVLADSGIEMNDHRRYTKKEHVATMNRKNREINKADSRSKSTPSLNRIDYDHSDVERKDYKNSNDLPSTKLIKEQKHKNDVLPPSSVLVKNYSKTNEDESKEVSKQEKSTKKNEKPEKEKKKEKLSRIDKVKRLMFGSKDSKKKKKKKQDEDENLDEQLRTRYTEYKGSDVSATSSPVSPKRRQTSSSDVEEKTDQEHEYYGSRQRLATPSPRLSEQNRNKQDEAWFKSLTRKNKHKAEKKSTPQYSPVDNGDESVHSYHNGSKHLRFFGDTDQESVKSQHVDPLPNSRVHSHTSNRHRRSPPSDSNSNSNLLQVPSSNTLVRPLKKKRHSIHDSSAESTTEGDSSQHSQKSVVYLHATTVGDIPGSKKLHRSMLSGGRKALSREELSSNNEIITPHTRTLSRSISVLAPWRPRHNSKEIHYDDAGKPPKPPKQGKPFKHGEIKENQKPEKKDKRYSSKSSSRRGSQELRKSKENLDDYRNDSPHRNGIDSITRERKNRDNFVFVGKRESRDEVDNYNSDREKRYRRYENGSSTINRKYRSSLDTSRATAKSTETLGRLHKEKPSRDLSRSMTMPKDSRLTSGWYKDKSNKVK